MANVRNSKIEENDSRATTMASDLAGGKKEWQGRGMPIAIVAVIVISVVLAALVIVGLYMYTMGHHVATGPQPTSTVQVSAGGSSPVTTIPSSPPAFPS